MRKCKRLMKFTLQLKNKLNFSHLFIRKRKETIIVFVKSECLQLIWRLDDFSVAVRVAAMFWRRTGAISWLRRNIVKFHRCTAHYYCAGSLPKMDAEFNSAVWFIILWLLLLKKDSVWGPNGLIVVKRNSYRSSISQTVLEYQWGNLLDELLFLLLMYVKFSSPPPYSPNSLFSTHLLFGSI